MNELVEKARDQCPPVVAEYDDLPFAGRAKETLAALRRLEWRAAVGKPDRLDEVNRGYLEAELAFLERTRALGVHRGKGEAAPAKSKTVYDLPRLAELYAELRPSHPSDRSALLAVCAAYGAEEGIYPDESTVRRALGHK